MLLVTMHIMNTNNGNDHDHTDDNDDNDHSNNNTCKPSRTNNRHIDTCIMTPFYYMGGLHW